MNKRLEKYMFSLGIFLGLPGQIIWALIFQNNDNLFMHHWTVAFTGMILVVLGIRYAMNKILNLI